MSASKTHKPWPTLPIDEAAVKFVEKTDLSEYDWSQAVPVTMEFRKKNSQLNVRLPEDELIKVRVAAECEGMPLSQFIRLMISCGMQTIQSHNRNGDVNYLIALLALSCKDEFLSFGCHNFV